MTVRLLLVVDVVMVAGVGTISALFVSRPAGLVGAAASLLVVVALLALLPRTDPYRAERRPASQTASSPVLDQSLRPRVWIVEGDLSVAAARTGELEVVARPDDACIAVLDGDRARLRQVRGAFPDLYVITIVAGITPTTDSPVVVALLAAGADRCLVSPNVEELVAQIHSVARRMRVDTSRSRSSGLASRSALSRSVSDPGSSGRGPLGQA